MTDPLMAIQNNVTAMTAAVSAIPNDIAAGAANGDFSQVLSEIQQSLAALAPPTQGNSQIGITGGLASMIAPPVTNSTNATIPPMTGNSVVSTAEQFLGTPYLWGGSTPQGFDCSGLVQYVYGQFGVSLPRTSQQQATMGTAIPSVALAQPGDLVFYPGTDGTTTSPGHVGIYIGNGQMIAAPETGQSVQIQPVGDPVAIRRVIPPLNSGAVSAQTINSSIPTSLQPLFLNATSQYGLPAGLLPAMASVESGFQSNAVSSAGAEGIMQIMPSTAQGLGIDPFNPAQAISGAAQLLSGYLQQFGSLPLAIAAYNAGPAAVAQSGGIPPFPETQAYVQNVLNQMGPMQ